jgi:hypothetical protein
MASEELDQQSRRTSLPLWCGVSALAALLCWFLPGSKDAAVLGRMNYWQFLLATFVSAVTITLLLVACRPDAMRRRFAFRASALWIGVVVGLGCVELACLLYPGKPFNNPWLVKSGDGFRSGTAGLIVEREPGIYWKGLSTGGLAELAHRSDPYAQVVEFVTDSEGFRNTHPVKDPDIVFIGDSFTEAGNVNEEQTFVSHVGKATGFTVRNLGRINYTPSEELVVLREFGLKETPRVVVWQLCEHNDLWGQMAYAHWQAGGSPAIVPTTTDGQIWMARSPTHRLFVALSQHEPWPYEGTFRDSRGECHPVLFSNVLNQEQRPAGHPGWPLLLDTLHDGHVMLNDRSIPLVIILIPMKLRVMGHYAEFSPLMQTWLPLAWDIPEEETFGHALASLCAEIDVPFVDMTAALKSSAAEGELVFPPFESHLSKSGHEIVAREIERAVRKLPVDAPGS